MIKELLSEIERLAKEINASMVEGQDFNVVTYIADGRVVNSVNKDVLKLELLTNILNGFSKVNFDENKHYEVTSKAISDFEEQRHDELAFLRSKITTCMCSHCGKEADIVDCLDTQLFGMSLVDIGTCYCPHCGTSKVSGESVL